MKRLGNTFASVVVFCPTGWIFPAHGSANKAAAEPGDTVVLDALDHFPVQSLKSATSKQHPHITIYNVLHSAHFSFRELAVFLVLLNHHRVVSCRADCEQWQWAVARRDGRVAVQVAHAHESAAVVACCTRPRPWVASVLQSQHGSRGSSKRSALKVRIGEAWRPRHSERELQDG